MVGRCIETALLTAWAATGAGWNVHPEEFDNGGGYSSSTNFRLSCSIGGSVISGNAGSASFANSSSFLPMLEARSAGAAPDLQVSAGTGNPADSNEGQGSTVPMLQVTLTGGQATDVVISFLTINASGTGADDTGVAWISMYLDSDGDGSLDAGETQIAAQPNPFAADDGVATLLFHRTVISGSTETWLVFYTFTNVAEGSFQAFVAPSNPKARCRSSQRRCRSRVTTERRPSRSYL